jgi:hypothetical protein
LTALPGQQLAFCPALVVPGEQQLPPMLFQCCGWGKVGSLSLKIQVTTKQPLFASSLILLNRALGWPLPALAAGCTTGKRLLPCGPPGCWHVALA